MKTYRIFLASSNELSQDRLAFAAFLLRYNQELKKYNIQLALDWWEDMDDGFNTNCKQDDYNEALKECHFFIMLFWTKVGKFTKIEFDLARKLQEEGKAIYLYCYERITEKDGISDTDKANKQLFLEELNQQDKEQFQTPYLDFNKVTGAFRQNFQRHLDDGSNKIIVANNEPAILLSTKGAENPSVFIGRDNELQEIRNRLNNCGKLMLINAEGGIGKTTLAAKYWNESLHDYKHNAWLFCDGGIVKALKELAPKLNVVLVDLDEDQQINALRDGLSKVHDNMLLVLDNANDDDDIRVFRQTFEGFHWHVLITSRCQGVLEKEQEMLITHLPPPLAKALFEKHYTHSQEPDFENLVMRILTAINYHTLLIEVFAKNAMQAKGINSLEEFIAVLEKGGLYLGEDSFEIKSKYAEDRQLKKANTDQILDVLYNFSALNPTQIYLLTNIALLPAESYERTFFYDIFNKIDKAGKKELLMVLNELYVKGWITQTNEAYRISQVIQKLVLDKHQSSLGQVAEALINTLNARLLNNGSSFKIDFDKATKYVMPITHIGNKLQNHPTAELALLFFNASIFYQNGGDSTSNLFCLLGCKAIYVKLQSQSAIITWKREIAVIESKLGDFYLRLGDGKQAETHYLEALLLRRSLVLLDGGNTSWQQDLATSLSKLGDFYLRLGYGKQAEEHYLEGLGIFRSLVLLDGGNTRWQQDLATTLGKLGDFYLRLGDGKQAETHYLEDLKISRSLVLLDGGNTSWQQDLATTLGKLGDFYLRLGDGKQAEKHYLECLGIFRSLVLLDGGNTRWQQDLATTLGKLGDFYLRLGDGKQAEKHYLEGLGIFRSLVLLDGGNTSWQQDLATTLSKLGDFYLRLGDGKQAETHYLEGLGINRSLVLLNGGNTRWQQDLATSLSKLGDFYLRLGDGKQVETYYLEALLLRRSLVLLDGGNTRWQQDLATSLSKLGDFYLRLGYGKQAEEHYLEGLGIFRSLVLLDGGNTSWQQDLATTLGKLGDFYLRLGDGKQAETHYLEDLKISRSLVLLDGGNTSWQQDLATTLGKLGDFYLRLGDGKQAEKHYLECLGIFRSLVLLDGGNTRWQQDLATTLGKLGDFYLRLGDGKQAEEHYLEGLGIFRSLVLLDVGNTSWQQDLATSLSQLGDFYLHLDDAQQAEEHYLEDLKISRSLVLLDVGNTSWQQDLATSLSKLGDFYVNLEKFHEALDYYKEAKVIHERLLEKDASSIMYQFDYALDFLRIGKLFKIEGYVSEAIPILKNVQTILQDLVQKVPNDVNFKEHLEYTEALIKECEGLG